MSTPRGPERRQFGRRTTHVQGWIEIAGRPRIACVVANLSAKGARLEFMEEHELPYRFRLTLPHDGKALLCECRHKGPRSAGVEFSEADMAMDGVGKSLVTVADYWRG